MNRNCSRQLPALIGVAVLIAAPTGCGDAEEGDTLTKAEVIDQGGAICREAEKGVEQLPAPTSGGSFVKASAEEQQQGREFLVGYADLLASTGEGLRQLDAPEEDRELLDGYIDDIDAVVAGLRDASEADPEDVEAKADAAFARFDRASEQTAEYGFPKGVCGSGAA